MERKATRLQAEGLERVEVIAQPFGGSIRIQDQSELVAQIHDFQFDSPRSQAEQDFRILIRPADWELVKAYCLKAFRTGSSDFLETSPERELAEEFMDSVQVPLSTAQYKLKPLKLVIENEPGPTPNVRAANLPTVRIYGVFEAQLLDPELIRHLLAQSKVISDLDLIEMARANARAGGKGRANGVLTLPVSWLTQIYQNLSPEGRKRQISADRYAFEANVYAILNE